MKNPILALYFLALITISHVLLPVLNRSRPWLFFSTWQMYSAHPPASDITWDGGKTYLFRDHRSTAREAGINIHSLFSKMRTKNREFIKERYLPSLQEFCHCQNIEQYEFEGSLYEHILLKKDLAVKTKVRL